MCIAGKKERVWCEILICWMSSTVAPGWKELDNGLKGKKTEANTAVLAVRTGSGRRGGVTHVTVKGRGC